MMRHLATAALIVSGLFLLALAILTIFSTGPFVFVMLLPGFFVLWAGLHRAVGPPWAFVIAMLVVAAALVVPPALV